MNISVVGNNTQLIKPLGNEASLDQLVSIYTLDFDRRCIEKVGQIAAIEHKGRSAVQFDGGVGNGTNPNSLSQIFQRSHQIDPPTIGTRQLLNLNLKLIANGCQVV